MKPQVIAHLVLLRRSLTSLLLTLPIQSKEMSVDALLGLLDHCIQHPNVYTELANGRKETEKSTSNDASL